MKNNKIKTMKNSAMRKNTRAGYYHAVYNRQTRRQSKHSLSKYEGYYNEDIWLDSEDDYNFKIKHGWDCCEYLYTTSAFINWIERKEFSETDVYRLFKDTLVWRYIAWRFDDTRYGYWVSRKYESETVPFYIEEAVMYDWRWLKNLIYVLTLDYKMYQTDVVANWFYLNEKVRKEIERQIKSKQYVY